MSYITLDDLLLEVSEADLVNLTDDEGLGMIHQERVAKAIASAQGEVDGYAGKRYSVPLDPVPAVIHAACVDISLYRLYGRGVEVPETWQQRYRNAVRLLENLAKGLIQLGGAGSTDPAPSSHAPEITSATRRLSRESLEGM